MITCRPTHREILDDVGIHGVLPPDTEDRIVRGLMAARDARAISLRARESAALSHCGQDCNIGAQMAINGCAIEMLAKCAEQQMEMTCLMYARSEPKTVLGISYGKANVSLLAIIVVCIAFLFATRNGFSVVTPDSGQFKIQAGEMGGRP